MEHVVLRKWAENLEIIFCPSFRIVVDGVFDQFYSFITQGNSVVPWLRKLFCTVLMEQMCWNSVWNYFLLIVHHHHHLVLQPFLVFNLFSQVFLSSSSILSSLLPVFYFQLYRHSLPQFFFSALLHFYLSPSFITLIGKGKCKAVPLQAWSCPECSRKLRFPDFMTTEQGGGKVVSLTHRPHLHPGNSPGTQFC